MLPALLLALACAPAAPDEFTEQLARLAAPRAAERAAAERWLEAHLVFERYPDLAEAALAGDAEVRGRLARVLSSDERHLVLALALCAEKDTGLQELGRRAVRAGVARADPPLTEPPLREGLEAVLQRAAGRSAARELRPSSGLVLEDMLEELELVGELPLGLTLDASAAGKPVRRPEGLASAPWNQLLWHLRELGVELECHGLDRARALDEPVGAFLRFATELGPPRTGVELVSDWLFVLAAPGDEPARARAARNLASSGFTPALTWMEHLVRTRGDRAAREGLLRAAARGRVAPVLTTAEVLEPLLAEAESSGGRRSSHILCGLETLGCFDAEGAALAPRLLGELPAASARGRWTRLFLLERNRCASPEADAAARALLADVATPPALALEALHVLAARGTEGAGAGLTIASLPALFRLELDANGRERLGRALALLGQRPPFADPAAIPAEWSAAERAHLCEGWLWSGVAEVAAAHLARFLEVPAGEARARCESLTEILAGWRVRGDGPFVARVLALARARGAGAVPALERLSLLLGLVPAAETGATLQRIGAALSGPNADLPLLAALGGYPVPIEAEAAARATLREALSAALKENRPSEACAALVAALEHTLAGLYSADRDGAAQEFVNAVWQVLKRNDKSPLARELMYRSWPPVPGVERRDLGRFLARYEVPAQL